MSSKLMVFQPRKFVQLLKSDGVNIRRDPTLLFAFALAALPMLLMWRFGSDLDAAMSTSFDIDHAALLALPFVLCLPAFMIGWVIGFLFLEERDDGPLMAIAVTSVGAGGMLAYRLVVAGILTTILTFTALALLLPTASLWLTILLAALMATEAATISVLIPLVARNKVEGLAATKVLNLFVLVPFLAFWPSVWRFLGGVLPTFWIGELLGQPTGVALPIGVTALCAVLSHIVVLLLVFRLAHQRQ